MKGKMKKLIAVWLVGVVLSIAFWAAVVFVVIHFVAKAW